MATGDLTFRGVTKEHEMYFNYLGQKDYSAEQDGSNIKAGFIGQFSFLARTDYGVPTSSIADRVTIEINANMRKE
jgi:polyisoprenoid-binding protein YceI